MLLRTNKVNAELFLCMSWKCTEVAEEKLHLRLTSALNGSGQLHVLVAVPPPKISVPIEQEGRLAPKSSF
jgi:hypothetical protein